MPWSKEVLLKKIHDKLGQEPVRYVYFQDMKAIPDAIIPELLGTVLDLID